MSYVNARMRNQYESQIFTTKFLFIYFLSFFYKVIVSIEIKMHHKMPIQLFMLEKLKTPFLIKKTEKVYKQKICCKISIFVLVVRMS